jgi:uncharacterized protein
MLPRLAGTVLALLVFSSALFAQSSVWKVTRGSSAFYLGGTCHVLRPGDFPLPAEFDVAYAASAKLIFETDISRLQAPEMQEVIASRGMFTDGTTLQKVLTPAAWKAAQAWSAKAGLPIEQVSRMRPWMFTVVMAAIELQKLGISAEGVDMHYFKQASGAGKKTGELESFENHLGFLTQLGAGHESEMIAQSIEEMDETPEKLNGLLAAWKTGDVAKLDELMLRELRAKYPSIFKALLTDRNRAWLPKLEELLKTPEIEFVLVGFGHIPGREGLLAQLRARGCTIEQIKVAATAKRAK